MYRHSSLFLAGSMALLTNAADAGLISNGDFEAFTPFFANPGPVTSNGWTFENHAGVEATNGNPDKGVRLESGGGGGTDPTIAQTVSGLTVGTQYTLSWDLALRVNFSGSGTGRSFGVFLDTQTFGTALHFGERLLTTFESQSVDFIATSTTHTFIFAGELDPRTNGGVVTTDVSYNLDNVDLNATSPVPEPSTFLLLGLGTALVLAWRHDLSPRRA